MPIRTSFQAPRHTAPTLSRVTSAAVAALGLTTLFLAPALQAAERPAGAQLGPVIENYGPVMPVPEGAFAMHNDREYKVVKDVSRSSDKPGELNRNLEAMARLLNMQARAGMPVDALEAAIVVHGPAIRDLLNDDAYEERFGSANPNTGLLEALAEAGVKIYLCGQTAGARGFSPETIHPSVTMALSAMGAHVRLSEEGYTLIPF
jgi:intracellular sulfur oxidation DsrE/DsrF family protein